MRMSYSNLRSMLIRYEGNRLKPYLDCCGKPWKQCICLIKGNLSIGAGRNLDAIGISQDELNLLLANDMSRVVQETSKTFAWYTNLNAARQDVILNMIFNMGLDDFLKFKKLIAALSAQDYAKAADEMLNSVWASQVGKRATELAQVMRTGISLVI